MTEQGWHADPFGRHEYRWHDGTEWTASVADAGVTTEDPPVPGPPAFPGTPPAPAAPAGPEAFPAPGSDPSAPAAPGPSDAPGTAPVWARAAAPRRLQPVGPPPVERRHRRGIRPGCRAVRPHRALAGAADHRTARCGSSWV